MSRQTPATESCVLEIKVKAGRGSDRILGMVNGVLKVQVGKKPQQGAANQACLKFLAECLEISRQQLKIIKGEFASRKTVLVEGLSPQEAGQRLKACMPEEELND